MDDEDYILRCTKVFLYVYSFLCSMQKHIKISSSKIISVNSLTSLQLEELCTKCLRGVIDPNATLLISLKNALRVQVFNGWVKCKFVNEENEFLYRLVRVIVSQHIDSDAVYISRTLLYNITRDLPCKSLSVKLMNHDNVSGVMDRLLCIWNYKMSCRLEPITYPPPIAKGLQLLFLESLDHSFYQEAETLIQNYFLTPKYVCVNDVISILIPVCSSLFFTSSPSLIPPLSINFLVLDIQGEIGMTTNALASRNETSVFLVGKNHEVSKNFICRPNSLLNAIPPCLAKHFNNISKIIKANLIHHGDTLELEMDKFKIPSSARCKYRAQFDQREKVYANNFILLIGATGSGKTTLIKLCSQEFKLHLQWINAWDLRGDTSAATEGKISQVFGKIESHTLVVLTNVGILSKDTEGNVDARVAAFLKQSLRPLSNCRNSFLIATAHKKNELSDDLWSIFTYHEIIPLPNIELRSGIVQFYIKSYFPKIGVIEKEELVKILAHRMAGFTLRDIEELFLKAQRIALRRVISSPSLDLLHQRRHVKLKILREDFMEALNDMQKQRSSGLGLPSIPTVHWEDIGGLEEVKKEVINTIQLPIKHPELLSSSLRRSGIVLYGPPGTGKTLLAKSVASECGLNFMSVKGPELLNMYVGQSEENVREVFAKAKSAAPCVIFFDELDSLAPNRGRSGDSGGVMDRIVSALLAELDGVAMLSDVFVLAATNRPDLLDPALLRPGRFEKQIYLGITDVKEERLKILKAVSSKIPLCKSVNLTNVVEQLPPNMSGADFAAVATDAFYVAVQRTIDHINQGDVSEEDARVIVQQSDFLTASERLIPSTSAQDAIKYKIMNDRLE